MTSLFRSINVLKEDISFEIVIVPIATETLTETYQYFKRTLKSI